MVEVFSGIQGEGLWVGCRQVFWRLAGCNLACRYCDTPEGLSCPPHWRAEKGAGRREFAVYPNPATAEEAAAVLRGLLQTRHQGLAVTGGEPLVQVAFVHQVLARLGEDRPLVYLETNGTLPQELGVVLPQVEIVSMDFKVPSSCGRELWEEHAVFLRQASARRVITKLVLTEETTGDELERVIGLIGAVDRRIPLVLQPVSPVNRRVRPPDPAVVRCWQAQALESLDDVRVIPQVHRLLQEI